MSDALRQSIAGGSYRVDADAVAAAMIARAEAARVARRLLCTSEVLVPADDIEIRRVVADESDAFPIEGVA